MNPAIAAAWISGAVGAVGIVSTAVTAWIGSRNTARATERALEASAANTRATLAAAREDRLWEKRCAVYEEVLTGQIYRQTKRRIELRKHPWSAAGEQELKMVNDTYSSPGFLEYQSRLAAYASDAVMGVSIATGKAHTAVQAKLAELTELREQIHLARSSVPESAPDTEAITEVQQHLDALLDAAEAADDVMMTIIRDDRSRPEAAMPPAEVPAVRRRLWLRRKGVDS